MVVVVVVVNDHTKSVSLFTLLCLRNVRHLKTVSKVSKHVSTAAATVEAKIGKNELIDAGNDGSPPK